MIKNKPGLLRRAGGAGRLARRKASGTFRRLRQRGGQFAASGRRRISIVGKRKASLFGRAVKSSIKKARVVAKGFNPAMRSLAASRPKTTALLGAATALGIGGAAYKVMSDKRKKGGRPRGS